MTDNNGILDLGVKYIKSLILHQLLGLVEHISEGANFETDRKHQDYIYFRKSSC